MHSTQQKIILVTVLLSFFTTKTVTEFLYPVDHVTTPEGLRVAVIHQKDDFLELLLWDPITHKAHKGLLSSYTPAGLTASPSGKAFCFIDNDRIYIKSIIKKSPQALDFMGVYELGRISWIDDESFYFSAKERGQYHIFYATVEGDLCRLTYGKHKDYLYPQKQNSQLFFIERDSHHNHHIKVAAYPEHAVTQRTQAWKQPMTFIEKLQLLEEEQTVKSTNCSLLDPASLHDLYTHTVPGRALSFLHMISEQEGFFIEHAAMLSKKDLTIPFNYYQLIKQGDHWEVRFLFAFSIATALLFSHTTYTRLYESMYPLLPRVTPDHIYYVSGNTGHLHVYAYARATGTTTQILTTTFDRYWFSPYMLNTTLYYGGALARCSDSLTYNSNNAADYTDPLGFDLCNDSQYLITFPSLHLTHS